MKARRCLWGDVGVWPADGFFFAEEMRLLANSKVDEHFGASKKFASVNLEPFASAHHVTGIECDSVNITVVCEVEGPLVVELL